MNMMVLWGCDDDWSWSFEGVKEGFLLGFKEDGTTLQEAMN